MILRRMKPLMEVGYKLSMVNVTVAVTPSMNLQMIEVEQ